jgi:hypothetical protein
MPYRDAEGRWAASDDAALIDELGRGRSVEAIAAILQRSAADVRARLDTLANATNDARASHNIFPRDIAAS